MRVSAPGDPTTSRGSRSETAAPKRHPAVLTEVACSGNAACSTRPGLSVPALCQRDAHSLPAAASDVAASGLEPHPRRTQPPAASPAALMVASWAVSKQARAEVALTSAARQALAPATAACHAAAPAEGTARASDRLPRDAVSHPGPACGLCGNGAPLRSMAAAPPPGASGTPTTSASAEIVRALPNDASSESTRPVRSHRGLAAAAAAAFRGWLPQAAVGPAAPRRQDPGSPTAIAEVALSSALYPASGRGSPGPACTSHGRPAVPLATDALPRIGTVPLTRRSRARRSAGLSRPRPGRHASSNTATDRQNAPSWRERWTVTASVPGPTAAFTIRAENCSDDADPSAASRQCSGMSLEAVA
mmetsp:Transcript_2986/g.12210  ORF Transcript_2986/g.12210 Transcript_2986/m.12210 type:complete len:362 (-) Transcript_2986:138-1223(-)